MCEILLQNWTGTKPNNIFEEWVELNKSCFRTGLTLDEMSSYIRIDWRLSLCDTCDTGVTSGYEAKIELTQQ